jgi:putative oxidoreductase
LACSLPFPGQTNYLSPGGTKPVYETLVRANLPFPRQTAYFVAGVEFVGGSLVTMGFSFEPCLRGFIDRYDRRIATLTNAISTLPKDFHL